MEVAAPIAVDEASNGFSNAREFSRDGFSGDTLLRYQQEIGRAHV
jgi:hypothetical protein